jgi:hypothetical protein
LTGCVGYIWRGRACRWGSHVGHLVDVDIDGRLSGVAARLRYGDTRQVGQLPASARLDESRTGSETHRDSYPVPIKVFSPWR